MSRRIDQVRDRYAVDPFDPGTWYRSVFGEGTARTHVGIGGDSGLSPRTGYHVESTHDRDFRGVGPKGYQRGDDRIREDVSEALLESPNVDPSDVEVTVENGIVTLSGTVTDKVQKFYAEDVAETIHGVKEIINLVKVKRSRWAPFEGYHWV